MLWSVFTESRIVETEEETEADEKEELNNSVKDDKDKKIIYFCK